MTSSSRRATLIAISLAAAGVFLVALQLTGGVNTADSSQFVSQIAAVSSGHLSAAFPASAGSATPPGFALVAGLLAHAGVTAAAVGVACALFLAGAAAALVRSLDPRRGDGRAAIGFAVVLALPAVWGTLTDLFHPQDLLATALICLALRAALTNRWLAAGVWLGGAFVTKQWAVLAAVPLIALAPSWRARRSALLASAGSVCALLSPFFAADRTGLLRVLRAASVARSEISLISHAPLPGRTIDLGARFGPVAASLVLVGAVLIIHSARRPGDRRITGSELVAVTLACLATRLIFDPTLFLYYLVPTSTLLLVLELPKRRLPVMTATWCVLTMDLLAVPGHSSSAATVDAAALCAVVMALIAVASGLAIGVPRERPGAHESSSSHLQRPFGPSSAHSPEYLVTQG